MKSLSELSTEELAEVRKLATQDGCLHYGHRFTHIMVEESLAPVEVICERCGASWRIHPDDRGKNFGQSPP